MKALHPADHEIKATRVPGGTDNTLAMAIDQIFTVRPSSTNAIRFVLRPNFLVPLTVEEDVANNGHWSIKGRFMTPALTEGTSMAGYSESTINYDELTTVSMNVIRSLEAVRITSACVTVNMLAPATANQGTCVSAQVPNCPQRVWLSSHPDVVGTTLTFPGGSNALSAVPYDIYDRLPQKSQLLSGTRAYTGQAREGCYAPLRLSDFNWNRLTNLAIAGRYYANTVTPVTQAVPIAWRSGGGLEDLDAINISFRTSTIADVVFGDTGNTVSVSHFDGYDETASFEVRVRMTLEARVPAGSQYAPLCQAPPLPDDLALRMYPEIAGRLKNAYPASYNEWGTLKKTIKAIGRGILKFSDPLIHLVTMGLPMGGAISSLATSITDGLRRKLDATEKEEVALMNAEERARHEAATKAAAAVRAAVQSQVARQRRQRRGKKLVPISKLPPVPKKPLPKLPPEVLAQLFTGASM